MKNGANQKTVWDLNIDPAIHAIQKAPWESKEFYRLFVSQIYHFVRYSTRMLAAAAASTENAAYYKRLIEHLREESGHEKLALADLKRAGGEIEAYPELGMTRALWEPQFYKVQKNPGALLGYILALEMIAVNGYPPLMEKLTKLYGREAVNFIRVHAEEDPDHVDKAIAQIESLPDAERMEVKKNFEQTCAVLLHLVADIVSESAAREKPHQTRIPNLRRSA